MIVDVPLNEHQCWVQLGLPDQSTTISLVPFDSRMPAGSLQGLIIETEDLETELKILQEAGIQVSPVENTRWGKFVAIKDPDGNGLMLHQHVWE